MRVWVWVWLLAAAGVAVAASGTVDGTVTNSVTGGPVKRALVTLRATTEYAGYQVLSDGTGGFRFADVQPGSYTIFAAAQGYAANVPDYALDSPPPNAVSVAEGQSVRNFRLQLAPLGAISGRVLDENGEPIAGVAVEALRYSYSRYGKVQRAVQTVRSNERGEYRLFDLAAGNWYLEASKYLGLPPVTGRLRSNVVEEGYPATYYPGAIELAAGADIRQADFRLKATRVYHVRGKTSPGAWVGISRCADDRQAFQGGKTGLAGTFDFKGLTPGCYLLAGELQGQPRMVSATQQVTVTDGDVNDIEVRLGRAFVIEGLALVEEASPDKLVNVRITLETTGAIPGESSATIGNGGKFTVENLGPASYRVRLDGRLGGLYVKSMRLGNTDISADGRFDAAPGVGPLTIVLRGDSGSVSGVARPAAAWIPMRIVAAPQGATAGRLDLLRTVEPEAGGKFRIDGLAPGEYLLFAFQSADDDLTANADFRKLLEDKATAVTVIANGTAATELAAIPESEIEQARRRLR